MKKINKGKNKKILFSFLALLVIIGGILYIKVIDSSKDDVALQDTVNYEPATETEKKETDQHKDELVRRMDEEQQQAEQPSAKKSVQPVISFWGQSQPGADLEIGGFVPGVIEDGGKCLLRLEKQGKRVEASLDGKKDASSTSCSVFTVQSTQLSKGTWDIVLDYSSSTSSGTSQPVTIEVK